MEFDLNDMVTFANAECHRILEYSEGSLIGKCLWDIAKASFPEVENCIEKTLREHPSPTVHFCSFRTPTDKSIDIQVDWNYERDPQGSVIGFVIVITDITQQRQAEEEARQHLDQLAHVSRMFTMNQMASGLAHELNQPLAAIANFAQACRYRISKSSIKDRNAILESIEQISVQADRAGQIIRRLRDFVRRADSSRSCENINDLVGDILSLLVTEARAHQIRLDSDLAADLPQVSVDRIQIEQVITNLVKNAMEASGDLAPALRCVTIRTEMNAEGMLDVSVTDTGKGIEVEELNQVFEPFYTTKQSGMGLGLSISRSIVEAHGGRLDAVRNAQTGMTFHFTLPIAADGGKA
jgi:PAS domain S-box-containing protein